MGFPDQRCSNLTEIAQKLALYQVAALKCLEEIENRDSAMRITLNHDL
jgi:hypothetical protein